MTVEAIMTHIDLAADKPLGERFFPLEHLFPGLEPDQLIFGLLSPELFRRADRLVIELSILAQRFDMGVFGKFFGTWKNSIFVEDGIETRDFVICSHTFSGLC